MKFTGLTDPDGNVIPVQGAGTVYDEEKNSLALGRETVATGQDQLVFGRKNVKDATKAELVGGGSFGTYTPGDVIEEAQSDRNEGAMIYAGHSLDELRQYLHDTYGIAQEDIVIDSVQKTVGGYDANHVYKTFNVPNVSEYSKVAFVVMDMPNAEVEGSGYLNIYGYDLDRDIIFQPGSELQGHFYYVTVDEERQFTEQGAGYFQAGAATLWGCVGNPALGMAWFSTAGNFYKSFQKLKADMGAKNIRTLDWEGNEELAGSFHADGDITCDDGSGNTISMRDLLSRIATLEAAQTNL